MRRFNFGGKARTRGQPPEGPAPAEGETRDPNASEAAPQAARPPGSAPQEEPTAESWLPAGREDWERSVTNRRRSVTRPAPDTMDPTDTPRPAARTTGPARVRGPRGRRSGIPGATGRRGSGHGRGAGAGRGRCRRRGLAGRFWLRGIRLARVGGRREQPPRPDGNAIQAIAADVTLGADPAAAVAAVSGVDEVAGRYRTVHLGAHTVRILLAKNPAGWQEALSMVDKHGAGVVIAVNGQVPDGEDLSWLWDVRFEHFGDTAVVAAGERGTDLAVRLGYAGVDHTLVHDTRRPSRRARRATSR